MPFGFFDRIRRALGLQGIASAAHAQEAGEQLGLPNGTDDMPRIAQATKESLLAQALALPDAQLSDFQGTRKPPGDAHPGHLKIIKDTVLRARLIAARIGEGLQSPKGPQKMVSIIRVYPEFNAPAHAVLTGRLAPKAVKGRKAEKLPTVEELETLLTRIRAIEGHVARETGMSIEGEIEQHRRAVGEAAHEDLEAAMAALGEAMAKRKDAGPYVREEAFKRIAADESFPQRVYLRYFSKEAPPLGAS